MAYYTLKNYLPNDLLQEILVYLIPKKKTHDFRTMHCAKCNTQLVVLNNRTFCTNKYCKDHNINIPMYKWIHLLY